MEEGFIHYTGGRRECYERGSLEDWRVKFYSGIYSAPGGLKRFWDQRARTSIDVLGLGILVGRVAGFGVS